jgi:pimeloyl-ACP methyl ester carboxylesterase
MVSDLDEFVQDHSIVDPIVIGHSMGGKTAMNFASNIRTKSIV